MMVNEEETVEAVEAVAPKIISQAIEENKLDVITRPAITSYNFEEGKDIG